jgi:hypothetical protein
MFWRNPMKKNSRDIDRYTNEDTAQMQAIWTGIILAIVVFIASFFYFSGKRTDMASNAPSAVEVPRTSGSKSSLR